MTSFITFTKNPIWIMVTAIKSRKNNKKIMLIEMSWSMETITLGDKRIGINTSVLEENITQMPSGSVF